MLVESSPPRPHQPLTPPVQIRQEVGVVRERTLVLTPPLVEELVQERALVAMGIFTNPSL